MHATALDTLVTFNPWTLSPTTPLAQAAQQLAETGITAWPVVDDAGAYLGALNSDRLALGIARDPACSAGEWAEVNVHPIELGTSPVHALEIMLQRRLRMLPVVDGGRLVGTLATGDFLRELSYGSGRAAQELVVDHLLKRSESIDSDATLEEADAAFVGGATHIVVVQGDFPLGVVTSDTLAIAGIQRFAQRSRGAASPKGTLGQLLQSVPTVTPGRTLGEAAALMVEYQLGALAVASQSAQLVGVLTEECILQLMLAA